jgi:2-hydroxy-3-oxopropionate reductase
MATTQHPGSDRIGVIGLGNMGLPMTLNLLAAGRAVTVTGRSRDRATAALDAGAAWTATPRELAAASDVIVLMVPDLPQVEELLFGADGLVASGEEALVVVCSSVSPVGLRELDARLDAASNGRMRLVDAPVSGGTEGAAAGTLSIMLGGSAAQAARAAAALAPCGTPVHLGPLGAGDVAKACNQLIVAATMTAIAEASVIAERAGLDLDALLTLLQGGYAGSRVLETKRERLVARDYSPTGVARFMVKDLAFAAAAADETATRAPVLEAVRGVFDDVVAAGLGDDDLAVVHRLVAER